MFILVKYGNNETLLCNPSCAVINLLTSIKRRAGYGNTDVIVDIADETGKKWAELYWPLLWSLLFYFYRWTQPVCSTQIWKVHGVIKWRTIETAQQPHRPNQYARFGYLRLFVLRINTPVLRRVQHNCANV